MNQIKRLPLPAKLVEQIVKNRKIRTAVTRKNHIWFFSIYFPHYMSFDTAPFQNELFALTENNSWRLLCVVAFRGSGKSTIITMSYAIWAILGFQQKRFVLILCQTKSQAKQHMMNLRRELESNDLLKNDLGPFQQEDDEWGSSSLVFSRYNARITVGSTEQSIRGLRHHQHRPDLIIGDDLEDLSSTKTRESRDKTYQWFTGEVIPAGDVHTRIVLVGNLLHEDSLLMRLRKNIEEGKLSGIFREYPLVDSNENVAWPGKFPTQEKIDELRRTIGNESAWQREYLLRIIADDEQVVQKGWLKFYDVLPDEDCDLTATGIDLAISEKDSADFTAMVSGKLYFDGEDGKNAVIYILPNPIYERMNFPQTLERAKLLSHSLGNGKPTKLYVEDVAYQRAFPQALEHDGYPAEGVKIEGHDKRARLTLTTPWIQNGRILFPVKGAERLLEQLTGFGVEKHDDLVDAFTILILKMQEYLNRPRPSIRWIVIPRNPGGWRTIYSQDEGLWGSSF